MIFFVLEFLFIYLLFAVNTNNNKCYILLCVIQMVSLCFAPIVDNGITFNTTLTYFNLIYSFLILFLIIYPWNFAKFSEIRIKDKKFFLLFKKILYPVLGFTIINDLIVLAAVLIFMPSIKEFKASQGYLQLYDQIPYFGILFRYASVSRYLGLFAITYFIFYLNQNNWKKARMALVMSMSTLIAACAFYSRAQIVSYSVMLLCSYLLSYHSIHVYLRSRIDKYMKRAAIIITAIFVVITVVRFSEMEYYGDRIPNTSLIQEPITYSVVDYASKGFSNGINQLEVHQVSEVMWGEQTVQPLLMVLSYFHILNWQSDEFIERTDKAYTKPQKLGEDNDSGSFHGYTCRMVKDFGYFFTFILTLIFSMFVRKKLYHKKEISFFTLVALTFLLSLAINSIFYAGTELLIFPTLFYIVIRSYSKLSLLKK